MKRYAIALVMCAIITGCGEKTAPRQSEPSQAESSKPLPQEAQSILDRLNSHCADEPWQSEVDMIERPETRPVNYKTSGEVNGFVSDSKERLAKLSVQVKWNSEKKQYEVEKTQQSPGE